MTHKIDSALKAAFTAGSFGLSVAHENLEFTPVAGTAWAQIFMMPNQPSIHTLGDNGQDLIDGVMQVNLNYPVGGGAGTAKQKATAIRDYFYAGRIFTYSSQDVFITSSGRGISRNVDSWYQVIVNIIWQARVTR